MQTRQRAGEMPLSTPLSDAVLLSVAQGKKGGAACVLNCLSFTGLPFERGGN